MSGLHSKFGFRVEELKPEAGRPIQGSSIPLILTNDLKYNSSNGVVENVYGARREILHVVPEALELLEGIEGPVSVLAICGPCRTGKSYILSRLLGTADAFELSHSMDPQTFGIWMGTKVLRGKDFTIVLLDTEGIDAVKATTGQDASILVMTILLSSQLIYNSLNVPHKGDLEKMQCFIKLAEGITVTTGEKAHVSAFREFFPDFLWLLRDVSLKMQDKDGKDMDPGEYLKKRVLSPDPDEFDESTSDKVGRAILTLFPSVECAILERPSRNMEVMNNIAQHTDKLNPKFNKGVEELTERLLLKSRAKRGYHKGSTVNGFALSIMTKQYVEAVNDPKAIPALDNTWKHTVEIMRMKVIDELVMEYNQGMQAKITAASGNGQVPMEEVAEDETAKPTQPTLMDIHNELFKEMTDKLVKKVGHFGTGLEKKGTDESNAVVEKMQNRLVEREERTFDYLAANGTIKRQKGFVVTGGQLLHYIQQNRKVSKTFCQELYERMYEPFRKRVENPPPDYNYKKLLEELDYAHQHYVDQARGPEKWVVLQEMTKRKEKLVDNFGKIKEYQRKLMQQQQRAQEAELFAKERASEVEKLYEQTQDMQKAHQETLRIMQQQHKEQMEMMRQEEAERRARQERKIEDLRNALMEQAKLTKEGDILPSTCMSASGFGTQTRSVGVEEYFGRVVANVSSKWDDLARELGFRRNEIGGIQTTEPRPDHRCREMLERWRNRNGSAATLHVLKQALINIDERLTAESL